MKKDIIGAMTNNVHEKTSAEFEKNCFDTINDTILTDAKILGSRKYTPPY